ncbi:5-carboxymethyl-2-hydroxymuconate delta-isomerase [Shigella flexneri]
MTELFPSSGTGQVNAVCASRVRKNHAALYRGMYEKVSAKKACLPERLPSAYTALAATGFFRLGEDVAGTLDRYLAMADGKHDYAFGAYDAKIRQRAQLESRQEVGEMLFYFLIKMHFASLMESRYLAFYLRSEPPTLNFKQNNVHALFK